MSATRLRERVPAGAGERLDRLATRVLTELVSRHRRLRGPVPPADGRVTLVTVDYHVSACVERLVASFRRFVGDGPVVVVDNGGTSDPARLGPEVEVVGWGLNLGHAVGLDLGLCRVRTEFALVCDPDTAVVDGSFWPQMEARLCAYGVAGVDTGNAIYHPLCVAFPTEIWKNGGFSFLQRWPWWDVGGELTAILGGVRDEALLPKSATAGPAIPSTRPGRVHHYGEVYGGAFTSTYLRSRLVREPDRLDFDGWSRDEVVRFHERWDRWIDGVLAGRSGVGDFPGEPVGEALRDGR